VDEHGWCPRHQIRHVGRLLELALEDSERGERYRRLWDGQPALPAADRRLPCWQLGVILDRHDSLCQQRWTRACDVHGTCTLQRCQTCPDYQPDE
jgi:hypothetical protein